MFAVCDKEGLTVVLVAVSTFSQAEILQKLSTLFCVVCCALIYCCVHSVFEELSRFRSGWELHTLDWCVFVVDYCAIILCGFVGSYDLGSICCVVSRHFLMILFQFLALSMFEV